MHSSTSVDEVGAGERSSGTGRIGRNVERRFYTAMSLALFAAVFLGFSRSFFLRPWFPEMQPLTPPEPVFYWHGALFTLWFLLLVVQALLVARGSVQTHRRLGTYGALLAPAMVIVGVYAALVAAGRSGGFMGVPVPPLVFLVVPLTTMFVFSLYFSLALLKRNQLQIHKRFILLATISMVEAGVARWPFDFLNQPSAVPLFMNYELLTIAFILPMIAWDLVSTRRVHPVTLWGGLAIVVSFPLRMMLAGTAAWQSFATWAVGLVG